MKLGEKKRLSESGMTPTYMQWVVRRISFWSIIWLEILIIILKSESTSRTWLMKNKMGLFFLCACVCGKCSIGKLTYKHFIGVLFLFPNICLGQSDEHTCIDSQRNWKLLTTCFILGRAVRELTISSREEAAKCMQKILKRKVMVSSARQGISGLLAVGGVNGIRYLASKMNKAWKSWTTWFIYLFSGFIFDNIKQ